MKKFDIFLTDAMQKVFPDVRPVAKSLTNQVVLQGEKLIFQLVYKVASVETGDPTFHALKVAVSGVPAKLSTVELIPSNLPTWPQFDAGYLTATPGLFPDLLKPSDGKIRAYGYQYRAVWIEVDTSKLAPGTQTVEIKVGTDSPTPTEIFAQTLSFTVLAEKQTRPQLLHTQWFYVDCLAQYYNCTPYDEKLWQVVQNYIDFAAKKCAVNVLLTPIFTPPVDTEVGQERLNVQLVAIEKEGGHYVFDFSKVVRWCDICRSAGITHLEIPHLFTQWGAKATPNIYLTDGSKIFGWDVPATDPSYPIFLAQLFAELLPVLAKCGYPADKLIFHIADEPSEDNLVSYGQARNQVAELLKEYKVVDALSDYQFYENGMVGHPVVANDAIQPFIDRDVPNLWTYYCCAQTIDVPNRFFALPSYRNRVMGVLLFMFKIEGFLHWGFNFYNIQLSKGPLNPYEITDANGFFPSGDPFLVYPGADGKPVTSIRNEVQLLAFGDLAALQALASKTSFAHVASLVTETAGMPISFTEFPQNGEWLEILRTKVNLEFAQ